PFHHGTLRSDFTNSSTARAPTPPCRSVPDLPSSRMGVTTRMPFRSLPISGFSGFPRKRQGRVSTAQRAAQFSHPVRKAPASPLLRPLVGGGNGFRKLPQGADLPPSPGKPVPGEGPSGPERLDILPTPQGKAGANQTSEPGRPRSAHSGNCPEIVSPGASGRNRRQAYASPRQMTARSPHRTAGASPGNLRGCVDESAPRLKENGTMKYALSFSPLCTWHLASGLRPQRPRFHGAHDGERPVFPHRIQHAAADLGVG